MVLPQHAAPAGEMALLVYGKDWSQTPLGAPETWSPSLRHSVALILAAAFPMAIRWGPELIFIYNDAYRPILGDKHPHALGSPLSSVWGEIYGELGPLNQAILRGERGAYFSEDQRWRVRRRGGREEEARFTISYSPIPDETAPNGIGGVLTTCIETTERVQTEQALRTINDTLEEQVEFRTRERDRIWQVSEDLLGVSNFDGYFISINPAWTQLLGWSEAEIKAQHVDQLRHPDDKAHSQEGRARLAAGVPTVRMENRFRHKDGSWRWIYWTMTAEHGLIYVIGRHVTAEKEAAAILQRTQEQLAQSQKMEAIGQLTGGIAHDFNNLLMIVSGNAEVLARQAGGPRARRAIEAIELAAAHGENLTRQLLSFSRRQALNPMVIDLGERLATFRDLLASSARGDITLTIDIPPDIWPVSVDLAELELALVNVTVNARDAMPNGGTIAIAARNVELRPPNTPDGIAGRFVALSIADSGCGIEPEILPKVFEPFFTTKGVDQGTGLGLSQVYGFSRQSGGSVAVTSRPGEGTVITIYLPKSPEPVIPQPVLPPAAEGAVNDETILLVEDNADVLEVAAISLEQLGYHVRSADNAAAALRLLEQGERIDLVFSDVVMPGELDGIALARRVRRDYPGVRVLLTSGYAAAASAAEGGFPILRKPYRLAALSRAVRDALDPQRAGN